MKTDILYIGNYLEKSLGYKTAHEVLADHLRQEGFRVAQYSSEKNKFFRMAAMIYGFFRHIRASYILIDLYSTSNFYYALIIGFLASIFRKKYILILHGGNLPERWKRNPHLTGFLLRNAYKNVAPSGYLKNFFEEKGFDVIFIPNPLPVDQYTFKDRQHFRPYLLWVRSFARHYRPEMAVEVLHRLKQKYPEAKLCMIGPVKDESFDITKQKVRQYGLENAVEFTGALSKSQWHAKAREFDFFINTTDVDNAPVSVTEAMALGLAVVSTNAGGLPFLLKDMEDAMLVDTNDPDAMAAKIEQLTENPGLARKMIRIARKKAENLDWKVIRKKWFDILK